MTLNALVFTLSAVLFTFQLPCIYSLQRNCLINHSIGNSLRQYAKSRMPNFSEEDQVALQRIMDGVDKEEWDLPDFGDNVPKKKIIAPKSNKPPPSVPVKNAINIPQPNANWREKTLIPKSKPAPTPKATVIPVVDEYDDPNFIDLDYDDFERAMFEVELGGSDTGVGSFKSSIMPVEHNGMKSGEIFEPHLWRSLVDFKGDGMNSTTEIFKTNDILVVYLDPRRYNEGFRTVVDQFRRIPCINLKISLLVVNCDDCNDVRKYLKKNTLPFPYLVDPSKTLMQHGKCTAKKRLMAGLFLIETNAGRVLKVWYENDWDLLSTRDLIEEEILSYRKNPRSYLESQIGLR